MHYSGCSNSLCVNHECLALGMRKYAPLAILFFASQAVFDRLLRFKILYKLIIIPLVLVVRRYDAIYRIQSISYPHTYVLVLPHTPLDAGAGTG